MIASSSAEKDQSGAVNCRVLRCMRAVEVRILDDMGTEGNSQMLARRRQQDGPARIVLDSNQVNYGKRSVGYYLKAIELSPLSMHLYDRLAKVYGTLEYYDMIQPLYVAGLDKVQAQIAEIDKAKPFTGKKKRLGFLRRAELTFNDRIIQFKLERPRLTNESQQTEPEAGFKEQNLAACSPILWGRYFSGRLPREQGGRRRVRIPPGPNSSQSFLVSQSCLLIGPTD